MKIWYLYHSSFLVEFENRVLIFDYFKDKPKHQGFSEGVVDSEALENYEVDVFVSHRHTDHYNPVIFSWKYDVRRIRYFLSPDIVAVPDEVKHITVNPDRMVAVDDIEVTGFQSNDEGVAFLVKIPEATIFFAGDLNWWDWKNESSEYRQHMQKTYCQEINKLIGEQIDVAFIPADPRLDTSYSKAIDYFMQTINPRVCVPIHLDGNYSVCKLLQTDPTTVEYRSKIATYTKRGEILNLPPIFESK